MFGISPLCPAYGRDYKSEEDAITAFFDGKDFITPMGQYTSRDELLDRGVKGIQLRFNRKADTTYIQDISKAPEKQVR